VSASRLSRDSRGTSAIEFAMVAPMLAMMVMGVTDFARGLDRKYEIQQASYRALELVSTGSSQNDYTQLIKAEAVAASGEPAANVDVVNWCECDGVKQSSFTTACPEGQQSARFVTVTIFSDFAPMFRYGPLASAFGANANGTVRLTARSTVRAQ